MAGGPSLPPELSALRKHSKRCTVLTTSQGSPELREPWDVRLWAFHSGIPCELIREPVSKGGLLRGVQIQLRMAVLLWTEVSAVFFRMHLDEALVGEWRLQCTLRHSITGDGSGVRKTESKDPVT